MAKPEQALNMVTMADGTIVEFAGKKKLIKTPTIGADGIVSIRLDFVNGDFRIFTLPADMIAKFAAHGAEQKLGDEIAGLDDVADAVMAVDSLIDRLYEGKWNATRESNGMAGTSILARALVEQSGKPIEIVRAFLLNKTQAEKVALRNNVGIKPIIDRLESEKVSKKATVDTDSLLSDLAAGNLGEPKVEDAPAPVAETEAAPV